VFVQITLFDDTTCEKQETIYMKWQQVKVERGKSGRGTEKQREEIKGMREGA
jgi:hypothetical protein